MRKWRHKQTGRVVEVEFIDAVDLCPGGGSYVSAGGSWSHVAMTACEMLGSESRFILAGDYLVRGWVEPQVVSLKYLWGHYEPVSDPAEVTPASRETEAMRVMADAMGELSDREARRVLAWLGARIGEEGT